METPSIAAGRSAGLACSAVFLAKRELAAVLRDELSGLPATERPELDAATRSVSVRYAADRAPRLAVYRDGLGCTTLPPESNLRDAAGLPLNASRAPLDASELPWPGGDLVEPERSGARLAEVVEAAFDGDSYGEGALTIGVAIVRDGKLVAERYRSGFGPHTQSRSWSAAKSITGALVGIAVGRGALRVDEPAPIPEWRAKGDPRAVITIENLLQMSSGLERAGAAMDTVYFDGADSIREIASAELEVAPGTRWFYSNRDTLLLVRALREALGEEEYASFPRRALLERIGMRSTVPELDAHGNFVLSSQVFTTARDLARFGLFLLQDGVWSGQRILPAGWVDTLRKPAAARRIGLSALRSYGALGLMGYGAQLWLVGGLPFVPDDAYAALGSRGQSVVVIPSQQLVVVRTGLDPEPSDVLWRVDRFVADVAGAVRPQ